MTNQFSLLMDMQHIEATKLIILVSKYWWLLHIRGKFLFRFDCLIDSSMYSYFNSQESVWSVLKKHLFKHFARLDHELNTFEDVRKEIEHVIKMFKKNYKCKNFMLACRDDLE